MRASMPLTLAALAGVAGAAELGPVEFHGFASQGYLYTTNNNYLGPTTKGGTFEFNEFALNATAQPHERVRIGVQVLAYDLVNVGNDKVQIDWAYGTYTHPVAPDVSVGLTAGRFKTGHGLYGDYRDIDVARSAVFLPMSTYSAKFRDVYIAVNGAGVSLTASGKAGTIEAMGYVGSNNADPDGPIGTEFSSLVPGYQIETIRIKRVNGGHLNWQTPLDGLRVHGSLLYTNHLYVDGTIPMPVAIPGSPVGRMAEFPQSFDLQYYYDGIAGLEFQRGNFTAATEANMIYFKMPITGGAFYSRMRSAYGMLSWRFLPKLEAATSYGVLLTEDYNSRTSDPDHRGLSFSLRFDPVEHWLIKAEFQRNRGTALLNGYDNPSGYQSQWWNLVAVKTTFDF